MALLEIKNIGKQFNATEILKDISFSLDNGNTLSIIGSSGSGKTTLLRCINYLEKADRGEIILKGKTIYSAGKQMSEIEINQKRKHFGMVFQQFNLFPQYTALENVLLAPKLKYKDQYDEIEAYAKELFQTMGLDDRMHYYPNQLSGGQQQRVAIARALVLKPDVLCFDEPTSALDPELTGEVLKVIQRLAQHNTTMIIVTHEIAFAREVSDKVIFMDNGEIVEMGKPEEVIDHPNNHRTKDFLSSFTQY